ncbi:MAG: LysR family transcriptional regulator [Moraxellaceae bacterium]|nr:LysR family transcriptional regulator [Moraxellaceae bacterium]
MARQETNRAHEMEVFVRVVELGGFSAAAHALRMTPSAVSKLVSRLEARLGTRLLNRSTRRLQLSDEGRLFHERSLRVLADMEEAERGVAANATPQGLLRVNTSQSFGVHFLLPLMPEFLALYPGVRLEIMQTDAIVDLVEARTDVAIRAGPMKDSALIARKLGDTRKYIVASPAYLAQHGTPRVPADLAAHNCLGFTYRRAIEGWPLMEGTGRKRRQILWETNGNTRVSDGEALRHLALAGLGLVRLAAFQLRADIEAGRLVPVLEDCNPGETEAFHAVYVGHGGHLPARVRAFLDFLGERVRM